MKIEKTTTWITGASSGIGRGIAIALAQQGERVIASARNEQALKDLESQYENIIAVPCDICDEASLSSAKQQIEEMSPALDRVILNAGNCEYLDFPDPDWDAIRRVMEVNFFGTINSVQLALPLLRRSTQRAHIVTVASQVTGAPFPRAEAYGASKAAVQYFFDSLRIDLADEKIDVTLVNPGFVDTPLTRKNNFEMPFLACAGMALMRHDHSAPLAQG